MHGNAKKLRIMVAFDWATATYDKKSARELHAVE
jgi:hypothetical protein